ncbi:MAG: oligosaccharide flippase family protein [Bacteroidia bacterium]|nr:oligosaccharide flippase family protein [Bacteroidia bacterium]
MSIKQFLKSDFIKNAGLLFSSSGIAQLLALIVVPFLTRIYRDQSDHGHMASFLSLVAIGVAVSTLKYEQAIMIEEDRSRAKSLVKLSMWINLAWFILFGLLLLLCQRWLLPLLDLTVFENWLYLIPITIFLTGVVEIMTVWWNRERKYKRLSGNRLATAVTSSGYKLTHGLLSFTRTNGLILGHTIGQLMSVVLYLPKSLFKQLTTNWTEVRELIKTYQNFPKWAMPSTLINVIGTNLPVLIITPLLTAEMTGYFSNALKLTYIPLGAVSYAIGQVFYERLARLKSEPERLVLTNNIVRFLFLLALLPVVVMVVWGDLITPFILGSDWAISGQMTQIVVLFYFVMYLSSPFAAAFEVYDKLSYQFWFTAAFTLATSLALYLTLRLTGNVFHGLIAFSFTGIIVRLAMMVSCFRLIGSNVIGKLLTGLVIAAASIALATFIRYSLS